MKSPQIAPAVAVVLGNALVVLPLAVDRFSIYWTGEREEVSVLSILTLSQLMLCCGAAIVCFITSPAAGWRRGVWLLVAAGCSALAGAEVAARLFRFDASHSLAARSPTPMLFFAVLGIAALYVAATLFRVMPRDWKGFVLFAAGMAATALDTLLGASLEPSPLLTLVGEGCEATGAALMLVALTWTAIAYALERPGGPAGA